MCYTKKYSTTLECPGNPLPRLLRSAMSAHTDLKAMLAEMVAGIPRAGLGLTFEVGKLDPKIEDFHTMAPHERSQYSQNLSRFAKLPRQIQSKTVALPCTFWPSGKTVEQRSEGSGPNLPI